MHTAPLLTEVRPFGSLPYGTHDAVHHTIDFVPFMALLTTRRPRVLCFSQDRLLGETRRAVLQRSYDAVFVENLQELAALAEGPPFDVIVLCHTLSFEERVACLKLAQTVWPSARFISITTQSFGPRPVYGAAVTGLEGPQALLSCVQQTLQSAQPISGSI